jgi:hypothetical protein
MPGLDGTGPDGMGPMTGGGFGRCVDTAPETYGGNFGMRRGRGRRFRQRFYQAYYAPEDQKQIQPDNMTLKRENDFLKSRISDIEKSLSEINQKLDLSNQSTNPENS